MHKNTIKTGARIAFLSGRRGMLGSCHRLWELRVIVVKRLACWLDLTLETIRNTKSLLILSPY